MSSERMKRNLSALKRNEENLKNVQLAQEEEDASSSDLETPKSKGK